MADPVQVEIQPTPNVNALKFVVNRRVTEGRSQTFRSSQDAAVRGHRLFDVQELSEIALHTPLGVHATE